MPVGVSAWARFLAVGVVGLTAGVWAAGSGLNVAVVVNQQSPNSIELGNYYCERRQVPPQNLLRIDWTGGNVSWTTGQVQSVLVAPLMAMISSRGLTPQIDTVVLSMDIPYRVTANADGNSTTSVLFYGFKTNNPSDPGPCRIGPDSFSAYAHSEGVFRWTGPGTNPGTFLATMLTGDTLADAKLTVDRGVDSDGTQPSRTVLLQKTSDPARNVRYFAFDNAIFDVRLNGSFPITRTTSNTTLGYTDLLGMQTGLATLDLGTGVFVPGAVGDSLTSYAGRLFEATGQTTLLAFLRAGAAASYGTVIEPCNYTEKFPNPIVYFYLARGFSLAASYYQSLVSPYQGLIVGEPLAAPFARPGQGAWVGLAPGSVLAGSANLDFEADAADSEHPLQQVDLFVDGTFHSTVAQVPPAPGNVLSATINGHTAEHTVAPGATLTTIASALADALNAQTANTEVLATAHGDRVELRSTSLAVPGAGILVATAQAAGTAGELTTFLRASRADFLDSTARGWRSFEVSGTAAAGDYVGVTITKTGGSVVELGVTNGASPVNTVQLTRQLLNAINASVALQALDGVSAEDNYAQGTTQLTFLLYARSPGWPAAQAQIQLWASPNLSGGPPGPVALDENLTDLQPRNHLYLTGGRVELNGSVALDTAGLADGHHDLVLVAYEGSHVRTQTRWSQAVQVQNTSLQATFTSSVAGNAAWIGATLQFTIAANTGDIDLIELFGTGGLLASATDQSSASFSVAAAPLGLGLHPFYALVTATDGSRYRTATKTIRLVPDPPPPTAASLGRFEARWLSAERVLVTWETGVEFRVLGFHLERQQPGGAWARVTPGLIPANGNGQPHAYQWEDPQASLPGPTAYRLVEIDWAGQARVIAQATASPWLSAEIVARTNELAVSVRGEPGARILLESATSAAGGPWTPLRAVHLDAHGAGRSRLLMPPGSPARFYRLRQE